MPTPSSTNALLERCKESLPAVAPGRRRIAQQEAVLRESGGATGQERQHKLRLAGLTE